MRRMMVACNHVQARDVAGLADELLPVGRELAVIRDGVVVTNAETEGILRCCDAGDGSWRLRE